MIKKPKNIKQSNPQQPVRQKEQHINYIREPQFFIFTEEFPMAG